MKFKVREGFHATLRDIVTDDAGTKTVEYSRISGGKTADFDEVNALRHLHALEPVDKEAKDFVAAYMDSHRTPNQQAGQGQVAARA